MSRIRPARVSDITFTEVTANRITPWMNAHGSRQEKGEGLWFGSWEGDRYTRLVIQQIKTRNTDHCTLDPILGIGFKSLAHLLKSSKLEQFEMLDLRRPNVIVANTGELHSPYNQSVVHIWPDSDADELAQDVVGDLENHALPFLARFTTLRECMSAWELGPEESPWLRSNYDMHLSGAYMLLGEKERGVQFMEARIAHYEQLLARGQEVRPGLLERWTFLEFLNRPV